MTDPRDLADVLAVADGHRALLNAARLAVKKMLDYRLDVRLTEGQSRLLADAELVRLADRLGMAMPAVAPGDPRN